MLLKAAADPGGGLETGEHRSTVCVHVYVPEEEFALCYHLFSDFQGKVQHVQGSFK